MAELVRHDGPELVHRERLEQRQSHAHDPPAPPTEHAASVRHEGVHLRQQEHFVGPTLARGGCNLVDEREQPRMRTRREPRAGRFEAIPPGDERPDDHRRRAEAQHRDLQLEEVQVPDLGVRHPEERSDEGDGKRVETHHEGERENGAAREPSGAGLLLPEPAPASHPSPASDGGPSPCHPRVLPFSPSRLSAVRGGVAASRTILRELDAERKRHRRSRGRPTVVVACSRLPGGCGRVPTGPVQQVRQAVVGGLRKARRAGAQGGPGRPAMPMSPPEVDHRETVPPLTQTRGIFRHAVPPPAGCRLCVQRLQARLSMDRGISAWQGHAGKTTHGDRWCKSNGRRPESPPSSCASPAAHRSRQPPSPVTGPAASGAYAGTGGRLRERFL